MAWRAAARWVARRLQPLALALPTPRPHHWNNLVRKRRIDCRHRRSAENRPGQREEWRRRIHLGAGTARTAYPSHTAPCCNFIGRGL
jgi:hypothetical protein